jgi:hypothetical protein
MSIQWMIGLLKKFNLQIELWSDDMNRSFEVKIWMLILGWTYKSLKKWIPDQETNKLCIQDTKCKKFRGTYLEGLDLYLSTL